MRSYLSRIKFLRNEASEYSDKYAKKVPDKIEYGKSTVFTRDLEFFLYWSGRRDALDEIIRDSKIREIKW